MSTRRTLGTGPSTTSTRTTMSPRLLPVERAAEHNEHQDDEEHQAVWPGGRRPLGTGPDAA